MRLRERRKPLERGTTSKVRPLRKWRWRGEHGGGEGARGRVRGEEEEGVRKGRGEEVQKRGNDKRRTGRRSEEGKGE